MVLFYYLDQEEANKDVKDIWRSKEHHKLTTARDSRGFHNGYVVTHQLWATLISERLDEVNWNYSFKEQTHLDEVDWNYGFKDQMGTADQYAFQNTNPHKLKMVDD